MKPQNSEASRRQFERRRLLQPAFVRTPNQKLIPSVIENISTGDWTRLGGKTEELNDKSMGSTFLVQNANKKSIQID